MFRNALKWYDIATKKVLIHLHHPLMLMFRLVIGFQFFLTGSGKLNRIEGVTGYFESIGIPAPGFHAYFVGGLEMVGGIALMLGVASRFFALPLTFSMIVAYITADKDAVSMLFKSSSFFQTPDDPSSFIGLIFASDRFDPVMTADPFNFFLMSLLVLTFGPGLFSVDALIRWGVDKKLGSSTVSPAEVPAESAA